MSEYSIQMHNYNGSNYDDLFPKTKSTLVIMSDGKTVEDAITAAGGGSLLSITFESAFAGLSFTVTGGGYTYNGTVPSSSPYTASCSLPYTSTTYKISSTLSGTEYSTTVATGEYYGSVSATLSRATITVTFGSDFSGKTYTITHSGSTYETGTVPSTLKVVIGVAPNSGSYTISSNGYSTSATAPTSQGGNTDVTLNSVDSVLDNNSYAIIKTVSDAGTGATYWSVGDRKGVVLNGTCGKISFSNKTYYMSILGFNHNSSKEGSNRIHFQFGWDDLTSTTAQGHCIAFCDSSYNQSVSSTGYFSMNSSNTNTGGWPQSQMRTNICGTSTSAGSGTFMSCLPSDLRAVLKSVVKTTNKGGNAGATYETSTDYIWLPSEYEVFGTNGNSGGNQDQLQYDYYKGVSAGTSSKNAFAAASKIRYNHTSTSSAVYWWERSPYSSSTTYFCRVNNNGSAASFTAHYSFGFAPCLCI